MLSFHLPLLFLLLIITNYLCLCLECSRKYPPTWIDDYHTKLMLYVPYAEIEEPVEIWYTKSNNQSRISYYNGMMAVYQYGNVEPYGEYFQFFHLAEKLGKNDDGYYYYNGTSENKIQPQTVLPDMENFECIGTEDIDNIIAEKWKYTEIINGKKNTYTMYLHYTMDIKLNEEIAIPLKFIMHGRNILDKGHYDHYLIHYLFFNSDINPEDNVDIFIPISDNEESIEINDTNLHLFNPIAEYIYPTKSVHVDHEFDLFKNTHQKEYDSHEEHSYRKDVFRQNMRFIHSINRQSKGYSLKINHLADRTDNELKILRGLKSSEGHSNNGKPFPYDPSNYTDIPNEFDWRPYGAVTPVKDQSICGSCWSFASLGAIEGAYFLYNGGNLVRLSEQSLIDCSWEFDNNGCDGGETSKAYDWASKYGVPNDDDYGNYLGINGICHADKVDRIAKISGYVNVTTNDVNALKLAISKHGPVSVSIDASSKSFAFYSHGVYYDRECSNDNLNHAILAIGYGSFKGEDYWLLKNSWSNHWGNNGYIFLSQKGDNCGVLTEPQYVTF